MGVRFLVILAFLGILPLSRGYSRCNDLAGISLMNNLVDCGGRNLKPDGFRAISSSMGNQATAICSDGCYLKATQGKCKLRYLKLILQHKNMVKPYFEGKKCNFNEGQLSQEIKALEQKSPTDNIWPADTVWIDQDTGEKFDKLPENAVATGGCTKSLPPQCWFTLKKEAGDTLPVETVWINSDTGEKLDQLPENAVATGRCTKSLPPQCWFTLKKVGDNDSNMGCEPVGEYSRIELDPPNAQCDSRLKKRVLCSGKIYCDENSDIYAKHNLTGTFDITCLGDMEGSCPSIGKCVSDDEVKDYSKLAKQLDQKTIPAGNIDQ